MSNKLINSHILKLKSDMLAAEAFIDALKSGEMAGHYHSDLSLLLEENVNIIARCRASLKVLEGENSTVEFVKNEKQDVAKNKIKAPTPKPKAAKSPLEEINDKIAADPAAQSLHAKMLTELNESKKQKTPVKKLMAQKP